ncbi:hypothetical protein QT970_04270 [Microcoleus sp. herbarium8]|uniref:hypothetical protein n=1 Tax=Microcoleus sp. herbarium8 TaxID=3055436 RepID=UPI002FD38396
MTLPYFFTCIKADRNLIKLGRNRDAAQTYHLTIRRLKRTKRTLYLDVISIPAAPE